MPNNIRKIRKLRRLSQERLAKLCNTSKQQIYKLEKEVVRFDTTWMFRLAQALKCHWAELVADVHVARDAAEEALLDAFRRLSDDTARRSAIAQIKVMAMPKAMVQQILDQDGPPASPFPAPRRAASGGD